jgi:hypothetical protein
MSGTKCPVSGTNQLVPDKMSGTLGYLFSGLVTTGINHIKVFAADQMIDW